MKTEFVINSGSRIGVKVVAIADRDYRCKEAFDAALDSIYDQAHSNTSLINHPEWVSLSLNKIWPMWADWARG